MASRAEVASNNFRPMGVFMPLTCRVVRPRNSLRFHPPKRESTTTHTALARHAEVRCGAAAGSITKERERQPGGGCLKTLQSSATLHFRCGSDGTRNYSAI